MTATARGCLGCAMVSRLARPTSTSITTMSMGVRVMLSRNILLLTVSRYSRAATVAILWMFIGVLDESDKHFVQRGTLDLEAMDVQSWGDRGEDVVGVGGVAECEFDVAEFALRCDNAGQCVEERRVVGVVVFDEYGVAGIEFADVVECAFDNGSAAVDQHEAIAESFGLFHLVGGEDDRFSFASHIDDDAFEGFGVDGVQA